MTSARPYVLLALTCLAACTSGSRVQTEVPLVTLRERALADSADAIAQYNLAIGYWSETDFPEARNALLRAVRIDPRFAEAYLALAYLPYAQRPALWQELAEDNVPSEWSDAIFEADEHYRRAIMINPLVDMRILGAVEPPPHWVWTAGWMSQTYDAWFRGLHDYRSGNYEAAFGRYDRLISLLEDEWRRDARERMPDAILLHRGLAAAHLGRWDIAIGDIRILYDRQLSAEEEEEELIHVPLETNHYRYILAVMLEGAGQPVEAEALLRDAVAENLGLYMGHVRLANLAESRGDGRTALSERQLAVNANPEDPTVHLEQGLTFANVGMLPQAIAALETAVSLNPLDPQAHYFLGVVHAMAQDRASARASLERFLALAPARMFNEISDAEARLASLR